MSVNIFALSSTLTATQLAAISTVHEDIKITTCKKAPAGEHIADTDILIAWGQMKMDALLPLTSRLKWVHALSAGVDDMLSPDFAESNIILTNSSGIHGTPIAEHVLGIMLASSRGLFTAYEYQKGRNESYGKTKALETASRY